MDMIIREAREDDIPGMHRVRTSVAENMLSHPGRISAGDYYEYLFEKGKGWVCEEDNDIIGFAIVDRKGANVWALFIDPLQESKGIGKKLHDTMLNWYFSKENKTIWLSTDPGTRAEKFYRMQGWKENGKHGNETRFEMDDHSWKEKQLSH
jgi:GNAT superfamily N-acetyltransferase